MEMHNNKSMSHNGMSSSAYKKLALMIFLSFVAMYILMYAMVDSLSNVFPNINQFYMAGLMSMPMLLIELAVMGSMYKNRKLNVIIFAAGTVLMVAFFLGIRLQAGVSDRQFARSMIPHHAAAILMVKQAKLTDPELIQLGKNIISGQEAEIEQMKQKLSELNK